MRNRLSPDRRLLASIVLITTFAMILPAAADKIGVVTDLARNAVADLAGTKRDLQTGADVAEQETISTDAVGKAAFKFTDETRLSVGPNSSILLDHFVFDPKKSPSAFVIKAVKGVFRFATGHGDHNSYRIETPAASIAVRGTQFDVVLEDGRARVSVSAGRVIVCPNGRSGLSCAEARKGQSVLAEPTKTRVVPTKSLPASRLALLPLPVAVSQSPRTNARDLRQVEQTSTKHSKTRPTDASRFRQVDRTFAKKLAKQAGPTEREAKQALVKGKLPTQTAVPARPASVQKSPIAIKNVLPLAKTKSTSTKP